MGFRSTKTFGHELGMSAAFRQWRADSHCRFVHGYALSIRIEFGAVKLDERNWVVDFGGLKTFRKWLEDTFDHKLLVAQDDPHLSYFLAGEKMGLMEVRVVENVGCEAFAQLIFNHAALWLEENGLGKRCHVALVEVKEHGANSAIFTAGGPT